MTSVICRLQVLQVFEVQSSPAPTDNWPRERLLRTRAHLSAQVHSDRPPLASIHRWTVRSHLTQSGHVITTTGRSLSVCRRGSCPLSFPRDVLDDKVFTESLLSLSCRPVVYQPPETTGVLLRGTQAGLSKQLHPVDKERTAGRWSSRTQPPHVSEQRQRVPAEMCEDILLNTLQNLMVEAVRGELDLTAHPRTISLPPVSSR